MLTVVLETNHKNIPPPRPLLHIPPLLLLDAHFPGMGLCIRRRLYANTTYNARIHIWALSPSLATHSNTILLPCRTTTWAWKFNTPRPPKRPIQSERSRRWKRRARIRILLGRGHKSVRASVGVLVRGAVLVYAIDRDGTLASQSLQTPPHSRSC
jgi:hypothetical protein